jgi:two-component system invasion response regulator UvrY
LIRALLADDHRLVREGLKQLLSEAPGIVVAAEAANSQEVMEKVRTEEIDVVLLDISMPGRSGLEVLKELKRIRPNLPVLMVTMYPEKEYAVRALKTGAAGYLTKSCAPDELITAVRRVTSGGRYVSPSVAEVLAVELQEGVEKPRHELLSNRELQVMLMIARGKTVGEIAVDMCLSAKTVSTYRARILEKLRLSNNAEITRYAIKEGLVE